MAKVHTGGNASFSESLPQLFDYVDITLAFKDPAHRALYIDFQWARRHLAQRSMICGIIFCYIVTTSLQLRAADGNSSSLVCIALALGAFIFFILSVTCEILRPYFRPAHQRNLTSIIGWLEFGLVSALTGSFCYQIFYVGENNCVSDGGMSCWLESLYDMPGIMVLFAPLVPVALALALQPSNWASLYCSWLAICISIVCVITEHRLASACLPFAFAALLTGLGLFYFHKESYLHFLCALQRGPTVSQQKKEATMERYSKEIKYMIGNVANDLKTPLTANMMGIGAIQAIITDMQGILSSSSATTPTSSRQSTGSIDKNEKEVLLKCMTNLSETTGSLTTTHLFMTMIINRCTDFTKARNGYLLVPRYETFSLWEVVRTTMNCINELQTQIEVTCSVNVNESFADSVANARLNDGNVFPFIISDKQWLQDNLLCLLSNATKFSQGIEVSIHISLVDRVKRTRTYVDEAMQCTPDGEEPDASIGDMGAGDSRSSNFKVTRGAFEDWFSDSKVMESSPPAFLKIKPAPKGTLSQKKQHYQSGTSTDMNESLYSQPPIPGEGGKEAPSAGVDPPTNRTTALNSGTGSEQERSVSIRGPDGRWQRTPSSNVTSPKAARSVPQQMATTNEELMEPLIGNRFSPPDELAAPELVRMIRIEIADSSNAGLTEDDLKEMFMAGKQRQRLVGGTGLGLFCLGCRVESLGGYYGVYRRGGEDPGSVFWFEMPYRPDFSVISGPTAPLVTAPITRPPPLSMRRGSHDHSKRSSGGISDLVMENIKEDEEFDGVKTAKANLPSARNKLASSSPPQLEKSYRTSTKLIGAVAAQQQTGASQNIKSIPPLHIMVVDGSAPILKMTSMMLRRHGHHVVTAENGADAVARVEEMFEAMQHGFDAILMDMQLPVLSGIDTTNRIRSLESHMSAVRLSDESSPTIDNMAKADAGTDKPHQLIFGLCDHHADNDMTHTAFAAGVDTFLPKPFTLEMFHDSFLNLAGNDL